MRYEAILAAAFMAGLCGAMSQQGVKPPASDAVETTLSEQSIAIPLPPAPIASAPPAPAQNVAVAAAAQPTPAAAPPAAPPQPTHVKHAHPKHKVAAKAASKQTVAKAEEHHSFWYRLFHKSEDDRVATAAH